MKDRGWVVKSIITIVTVFFIINLWIVSVNASPFTTVTVSFEDSPSVDVSPGSSDIDKVHGEVKVVKVGPDQVKVYLEANSTFESTSITPASLVFSGPSGTEEIQSFSVSVKVPQGTSCSESGTVTVSGYWIQGGLMYDIAPVSTIVIIEQYYKMKVSIDKTGFLVDPGDNIDVDLNVANEGNGDDIYQIDIENQKDLEDDGFALPAPIEVDIGEGANKDVSLKIGIPKYISGSFSLKIRITSKGSETSATPCKEVKIVNMEVIGDGQKTDGDGDGDGNDSFDSEFEGALILPLIMGLIIIVIAILAILSIGKRSRVEIFVP
ncbi:MAG: hypothetical protein JSV09_09240 [Thermoplasmata archaeon]|nr:MAG: hypothetical protein JSV09_09240 [Thermoplasmata archaeon]